MVTMVVMGKTGTGKSTFCNSLLQGDTDPRRRPGLVELFNTSPSINACTYKTDFKQGTLLGDKIDQLEVVDTPGLSENETADAKHIIGMIKVLKHDIQKVNLFLFVING